MQQEQQQHKDEPAAAPENNAGIARKNLELPVAKMNRIVQYAKDKGVTAKYIIERATDQYFDRVNEREGNKYIIQEPDKNDIL